MLHLFRRIGFFRRRWILLLLAVAALAAAAYFTVPWRGPDAHLQLVALTQGGTFRETLRVRVDTLARPMTPGASVSIPLVLAISNEGYTPGRPGRLELALPDQYRLVDRGGRLRHYRAPSDPLRSYVLPGPFPEIEGRRVPTVVPGVDTLWLEPVDRRYFCVADADSIPELVPAPPRDTAAFVPVHVLYSFEGGTLSTRQTGLLTIELPSSVFSSEPVAPPSAGAVSVGDDMNRPEMTALTLGGTRRAECGAPGDPVELLSTLWFTPDSGRFIVVDYGGVPRKHYFDLNRDSIIELEMWDADGDGEYDASRPMRVPIPEYLLPVPPPPPPDTAVADSLLADSLRVDTAAADTMAPDTAAPSRPTGPVRRFMRFDPTRGWWLVPPRTRRAPELPGLLGDPLDGAQQPVEGEPSVEPEPEPEPPPRRRNVPLGEPVGG